MQQSLLLHVAPALHLSQSTILDAIIAGEEINPSANAHQIMIGHISSELSVSVQ